MGNKRKWFVTRASVIAIRSALAALAVIPAAYAADSEEAAALTRPTNTVEVGVGTVDKGSYKFGEYNGLDKKGAYLNGGFSLRGGGGYDSDSTTRWGVEAANLGLNTRSLSGEFGEQGKFRINFGYDEIQRNQYDSYKTPYSGAGTKALTLTGYPTVRTGTTGLANWNNFQSPYATGTTAATYAGQGPGVLLPAMMSDFKVDTLRKRASFEVSTVLSPAWQFKFSAKHEDKEGTKLTGVAPAGGLRQGLLAPEPINHDTNQFKANLTFFDVRGNLDLGYYGSIFQNKIKSWSVANPFASTTNDPVFGDTAHLIGAPSNEMHRFNLTGAYNFARTTRLVVSGYYQRMTQNESFQGPFPAAWVLPDSSMHGLVVNKSFNATLTMRPTKTLSFLAAYKYEDRDNRTQPKTYTTTWNDATTASAGNFNTWSMEPFKRLSHQLILDGDYQFAPRQAIKAGYEWQEIERDANLSAAQAQMDRYRTQMLAAGLQPVAESPWKAEKTKENTVKVEYRNNLSGTVTGRLGYNYSQRRTHYEDNESLAQSPTNPPRIAPDGYFPAADPFLPGFRQFYLADRNRDRLRGAMNVQATEALALQSGLSYNKDNYSNSPYGLKNDRSWVFNLDGTYTASDNLSLNAFYTYEDKQSQLDSLAIARATNTTSLNAIHTPGNCTGYTTFTPAPIAPATSILPADHWYDPCRNWSETQNDRVNTLGLGFKAGGLMGGKLDVAGDLAYSRSRTPISFTGGSYAANGAVAGINNVWVAAQSFPDITSELIILRLTGRYTIDKANAVRVVYQYNHLKSSDWQWDAYLSTPNAPKLNYAVTVPGMLGTGITSPNYTVNSIMVTYIYSFR